MYYKTSGNYVCVSYYMSIFSSFVLPSYFVIPRWCVFHSLLVFVELSFPYLFSFTGPSHMSFPPLSEYPMYFVRLFLYLIYISRSLQYVNLWSLVVLNFLALFAVLSHFMDHELRHSFFLKNFHRIEFLVRSFYVISPLPLLLCFQWFSAPKSSILSLAL